MLQRLKKLWALSRKDTKALEEVTPEQVDKLPEDNPGDGKAEFIPEATQEDFDEFEKEEKGTKAWYDRIRKL